MRHSSVQNKNQDQNKSDSLLFDQKLYKSLKSIVKLLPIVQFTFNYGFAIENLWVTILMITHGNPITVDSFVWIVPIIIAIILRPYLIGYLHKINYKVYRQITVLSICLVLGAFGCYLVGHSCELIKKSQFFRRILQCSIGWTIMDVAFEFCQFLIQKVHTSFSELHQSLKGKVSVQNQQEVQDINKKSNTQPYGLLLGYVVSLLICWFYGVRSIKQFYKCCKYAYWTVCGLSLIIGLRILIESFINLPKKQQQQSKFKILQDQNLPRLRQILSVDFKTFSLLVLHFVVTFVNDIILIYTTMWFSEPKGVEFSKPAEALMTGLEYGSISLILYTVIDNLKINNKILSFWKYFEGILITIIIFSIMTYFLYGNFTFLIFGSLIAIMNQFYRHTVLNKQIQSNKAYQRCIEMFERIQKIFVLSVMPSIVMLILQRDDIKDCLLWASAVVSVGVVAFRMARRGERNQKQLSNAGSRTVKMDKVQ